MLRKSKVILGLFLAATVFAVAGLILVVDIFTNVPDFTTMRGSVKVPIRLANGDKSTKMMGPQAPGWVPLAAMSKYLPSAVVASEDTSFYSHDGIDMHEIREAIKKDFKEKRMARGASTLTQQVLKNVFLGSQKTLWRKIKEIFWAKEIEKVLSKREILAFYLNMAEWGPGLYGIGAASRHYFSVSPSALTPRQSAFLAMLLPSPRRYHAYFRSKQLTAWASKRVNRILNVMRSMSFIDESEYQLAMNENLWGAPALPENAPGVPSDPGFVTESPDDEFEPRLRSFTPSVSTVPSESVPNEATIVEPTVDPDAGVPPEPISVPSAGVPPRPIAVPDAGVPPRPIAVPAAGVPPRPIAVPAAPTPEETPAPIE